MREPRRSVVRRELVARQIDEQIATHFPAGGRLRVLDVGLGLDHGRPRPESGAGAQALRLARAGHEVTGLETEPRTLAAIRTTLAGEPRGVRDRVRLVEGDARETGVRFAPGSFDLVLCHGVLMYLADPDRMLAGLARVLAPGGMLSLLVRNADALAMRPGMAGDWSEALAAFDRPAYTDRFGREVRADRLEALIATLSGIGAPLRAWYGVRLFTDAAGDDHGAGEQELEHLLAVEARAGRTDPYRSVADLLHLCGLRA